MKLRPYQEQAIEAIYDHLRQRDDNPCVVVPTGGGKTPILSTVCKDAVSQWNGRVLILAHVKELLEQAVDKLHLVAPELFLQIGVYSAGLKSRDTQQPIIVAGIQSVYQRARELGSFDLIIIDEAHLIPPDGDGMYRACLKDARALNPDVRVIGLTATPYRMKSGMICEPANILNHVCFEVGVRELIVQGYLCPLVTKASKEMIDTSGLHVRAGEFNASETEELMNNDDLVTATCKEILAYTGGRKSVLIFASGVTHGCHIAAVLRKKSGKQVGTVFGDTLAFERDATLNDFKDGKLKYLVNVGVLTTGFDAPNIDCVAMVRPTLSPGLYYQMVGRGFRLCEGKDDCLVLDFGGNVLRHGPVDAIRLQGSGSGSGTGKPAAKECPECHSVIATGYSCCPDCGYEFPPAEPDTKETEHDSEASEAPILSGQITTEDYDVVGVEYSVHHKRNAPDDAPRTMRVEYRIGLWLYQSEWVCFEHDGYAREKAESWWRRRSSAPIPEDVETAVAMAEDGALCKTKSIKVRSVSGEKYDRIIGYELGEKPSWYDPYWNEDESAYDEFATAPEYDDEVPF